MTALEALALCARADFAPFSEDDWNGYGGCQSDFPQIAFLDGYALIIDGDCLVVHGDLGDEVIFQLREV